MSKREEIRARRKKERNRNRLFAILAVVAGALLVTFFLILPGLRGQNLSAGSIVKITPVARSAATHGTSLGDPNAPVKLDVWEDFQCSGCKAYSDSIEAQVVQSYVDTGKVYYTFHFYPFIDGGQGESHQAANAAMCANAQDRFWDYHDMLFANWKGENQGSYTDARLVAFAQALGLDMTKFDQCFKANTYAAEIQHDADIGKQMGVPPTPGIFVDDKLVVSSQGPNYIPSVDDISKAIEAALAGG